jgi:hypothetical protein
MIKILQQDGPQSFVEKMNSDTEEGETPWNPSMKQHLFDSIDAVFIY